MNPPTILSCGEVLWDLFPDGPRFGGAPANFACHAALLGAKVSLVSAVGDDAPGREASAILEGFGLDVSLIRRVAAAPTGAVGVSVDAAGKPSFEIREGAAWDQIAWSLELATRLAHVDAVYFGTLGQRSAMSRSTIQQALRAATARGIPRVLDVNLRPPFFDAALIRESIGRATVLKLSDDELAEVTAACGLPYEDDPVNSLRSLLTREKLDVVAMTRGSAGALLVSATEVVDQPGIPTVVCDTVGAGDAFTAALVFGLLRLDPLPTIARTACEIAAAVCAQPGAVPARPKPIFAAPSVCK
jgi:fructokinase